MKTGPAILLLGLLLCSKGVAGAQATGVTTDTLPNHSVRVQNTGPGLWDKTPRWTLEEVFRLGVVEGGGPEEFGSVVSIGVDSTNRVFVLDGIALEVRVFDSLGEFSHSIGGRGEGPGEFRAQPGISVTPGGELWTEDVGNVRYSHFSRNGEYQAGFRREIPGVIIPSPSAFSPEWGFVDWAAGRGSRQDPPDPDGAWATRYPVVFSPPAQYDSMPPLAVWRENASDGNQSPWAEGLLIHVASNGDLWFGRSYDYSIFRRTLEGDTTLVTTLVVTAEEWSRQERDSLLHLQAERRRPDLSLSDVPRTKPILRKIFSDGAGHVFVVPQVSGVPAGTAIDVFRMSGHYLGRLTLPEKISFRIVSPVATRNRLFALVLDEYDVSHVVSWRLVKPGTPPR